MPAKFQLFADHPALDFVNTLDNRFLSTGTIEMLHNYGDLLCFAEESDLLDARRIKLLKKTISDPAAKRVMRSALRVREALASVLYGSMHPSKRFADDALQTLQTHFVAGLRRQRLVPNSERNLDASWAWSYAEPSIELPVWLITQSAIALLTSPAMQHVHACAGERCRWLFLDASKNHSRRWCNMTICGNRMKAHRFHARHEAKGNL
jgi:predicted RNA-binding Zn ribbon-like protein